MIGRRATLTPQSVTPASITPPSITPSMPSGGWFAPMSPGPRAVAVLPFVYRGDADHDYLGEGMAEELIDVLSRTKGLRVLALGATRRFADARDPAAIGRELSADAVVDGTVQLTRDRVRISARLLDTDSGLQRWSERFDGHFEDVFALQESMGRRVAESLRVEIGAALHRHTAPQEAIELYLRARKDLRQDARRAAETMAMLERCLELAPGLLPAYPAHAMAALRAWWRESRDVDKSRGVVASESVERACKLAPDLAETHLAKGMLAVQGGHFPEASAALAKALEIAPTMADAHQYLADLQVEAGRSAEGKRRAQLALELDPTLLTCHMTLARVAALDGDFDAASSRIAMVEETRGEPTFPIVMTRLRYALWRRDHDAARNVLANIARFGTEGSQRMVGIGQVALGALPPEPMFERLDEVEGWVDNPRFTSLMHQIAAEAFCSAGADELGLECIRRAAAGVLIDLDWMRRCPLFEPLKANPVYLEARALVEQRADAIWKR
jgi:serine/threonine-protein kinase